MTIPVKGLHLTDDGPIGDLFASPWTVVGHSQFNELEERYGSTGNIRKMREDAWPTAIFFYRYNYPQVPVFEAVARAEYALAALSMSVLLHAWPPKAHEGDITNPRPIFRSRYSEYFDLPIALDQDTQRISGGGKSAFSLLRPDQISPDRELSIAELEKIISSAPAVVRSVLAQEPLNKRERRLADGMAVINSAFQTLSAGAFVSSLVSATEVLVDSQSGGVSDEYSSSWDRRLARIKTALGRRYIQVLDEVLRARHKFVHSGRQPNDDRLPLAALGIAVQVWSVMATLYQRMENIQDVEVILDAVAVAARASEHSSRAFRLLSAEIPTGAVEDLPWISFWLEKAVEK